MSRITNAEPNAQHVLPYYCPACGDVSFETDYCFDCERENAECERCGGFYDEPCSHVDGHEFIITPFPMLQSVASVTVPRGRWSTMNRLTIGMMLACILVEIIIIAIVAPIVFVPMIPIIGFIAGLQYDKFIHNKQNG